MCHLACTENHFSDFISTEYVLSKSTFWTTNIVLKLHFVKNQQHMLLVYQISKRLGKFDLPTLLYGRTWNEIATLKLPKSWNVVFKLTWTLWIHEPKTFFHFANQQNYGFFYIGNVWKRTKEFFLYCLLSSKSAVLINLLANRFCLF